MFGSASLTAETVRDAVVKLYGNLAYEHADSYPTMLKSLAAGQVPLAFKLLGEQGSHWRCLSLAISALDGPLGPGRPRVLEENSH